MPPSQDPHGNGADWLDQALVRAFCSESDRATNAAPAQDAMRALLSGLLAPPAREPEGAWLTLPADSRYELLDEAGRGGLGIVYRGRDRDLDREVALKVLDGRLADDASFVRRFVEEAQVCGRLQHPGVVPVHEVGLDLAQRPFFVMKLIAGQTFAEVLHGRSSVADQRRQCLDVFERVCQTMAYAHGQRVIHRDLKPANVMIGAFGEVQVVDWGLAKVLGGSRALDPTPGSDAGGPLTNGHQSQAGTVLGTPSYMPPEQARGEIERLDTRSDVFALGAMLCEILTGTPPYPETDGEPLALARAADLTRLHDRLARCGAERELIDLATQCLQADPRQRPESASAVARAIGAHFAAAEDRARTAQVQAATAKARARATLLGAGTVLCAVLLGAGSFLWLQQREHERQITAAATLGLLEDVLVNADPAQSRGADYRVEQLLDDLAIGLRARPEIAPAAEATVRRLLGRIHLGLSQADAAESHLEAALRIRLALWGDRDGRVVESMMDRVAVLRERGRYVEAAAACDQVWSAAVESMGSDHEQVRDIALARADLALELGEVSRALEIGQAAMASARRIHGAGHIALIAPIRTLAKVFLSAERVAKSEQLCLEALEIDRAVRPAGSIDSIELLLGISAAQRLRGNLDGAITNAREAMACCERLLPPVHPTVATCLHCLAQGQGAQGQLAEAEASTRSAIAVRQRFGEHPELAFEQNHLAAVVRRQGRLAEAEELLRQALALLERCLGADSPRAAGLLANLGEVLRLRGTLGEAESLLRRAVELSRTSRGRASVGCLGNLALTRHAQGDLVEAEQLHREVVGIAREVHGPSSTTTALALHNLGCVVEDRGRLPEAIVLLRESVGAWRAAYGAEHPRLATELANLADALSKQGELEEAEDVGQQVLAMRRRLLGDQHADIVNSWRLLARIAQRAGRHVEASDRFRAAMVLCRDHLGAEHLQTGVTSMQLADAMATGQAAEAEQLYRTALVILRNHPGQEATTTNCLLQLGQLLLDQDRQAESESLFREALALATRPGKTRDGDVATALVCLGRNLLLQQRPVEAEPYLREAFELRQETHAGKWQLYSVVSLLGGALAARGLHAEADPLLREGCDQLLTLPGVAERWRREALVRLIENHEALGQPEQSAMRRQQLQALTPSGR